MFLLTVDVLVQDFVSLHDKYEAESESRSTVRVVHVASQQVQASLDSTIKVATCYVDISTQPKQITPISAFKDVVPTEATRRKKEERMQTLSIAGSTRATQNMVPRRCFSDQT